MILNDHELQELYEKTNTKTPFIRPFIQQKVSRRGRNNILSYGLGSFGYDIRLGHLVKELHSDGTGGVLDPLNPAMPEQSLHWTEEYHSEPFELAPHGFILGTSHEIFCMPRDVVGLCIGKSTYARAGILINATPLEPGWEGQLTLEISNMTDVPVRLYPQQGIAQILFFRGDTQPLRDYRLLGARYQNQQGPTLGR